jgi:hypothetical protein
VNDVSTPGNGQRAKQYLPFLMRAGKLFGTVENVSSGELLARTASRCRTTFLTRL